MKFSLNIHYEIDCNNKKYGVIYLDYPKFAFEKRFYMIENGIEYGLAFQNNFDYYTKSKDKESLKSYQECTNSEKIKTLEIIKDFKEFALDKIIKKSEFEQEQKIIKRLFEELESLINK